MTTTDSPTLPATRTPTLSDEAIASLVAALLVAFGGAMTLLFGLPGLAMTALALVPVMMVVLILISVGK